LDLVFVKDINVERMKLIFSVLRSWRTSRVWFWRLIKREKAFKYC